TTWAPSSAKPVTKSGAGLGATFYHAQSKRYISAAFGAGVGTLAMYDAPNPWGPWTTFEYETNWGGFGNTGEALAMTFPLKGISGDGRTIWGVFSWGSSTGDALHLMKATLTFKGHVEIVGMGGKCADASGAQLVIEGCSGSAGQTFTYANNEFVNVNGKCL